MSQQTTKSFIIRKPVATTVAQVVEENSQLALDDRSKGVLLAVAEIGSYRSKKIEFLLQEIERFEKDRDVLVKETNAKVIKSIKLEESNKILLKSLGKKNNKGTYIKDEVSDFGNEYTPKDPRIVKARDEILKQSLLTDFKKIKENVLHGAQTTFENSVVGNDEKAKNADDTKAKNADARKALFVILNMIDREFGSNRNYANTNLDDFVNAANEIYLRYKEQSEVKFDFYTFIEYDFKKGVDSEIIKLGVRSPDMWKKFYKEKFKEQKALYTEKKRINNTMEKNGRKDLISKTNDEKQKEVNKQVYLAKLDKEIANLNIEMSSIQKVINANKEKIKGIEKAIDVLKSKKQTLEKEKKVLKVHERGFDALKETEIAKVTDDIEKKKVDLEKVKKSLKQNEELKTKIQSEINRMENERDHMKNLNKPEGKRILPKITDNKKLKEISRKFSTLKDHLTKMQAIVVYLDGKITGVQDEELRKYNDEINEYINTISSKKVLTINEEKKLSNLLNKITITLAKKNIQTILKVNNDNEIGYIFKSDLNGSIAGEAIRNILEIEERQSGSDKSSSEAKPSTTASGSRSNPSSEETPPKKSFVSVLDNRSVKVDPSNPIPLRNVKKGIEGNFSQVTTFQTTGYNKPEFQGKKPLFVRNTKVSLKVVPYGKLGKTGVVLRGSDFTPTLPKVEKPNFKSTIYQEFTDKKYVPVTNGIAKSGIPANKMGINGL